MVYTIQCFDYCSLNLKKIYFVLTQDRALIIQNEQFQKLD